MQACDKIVCMLFQVEELTKQIVAVLPQNVDKAGAQSQTAPKQPPRWNVHPLSTKVMDSPVRVALSNLFVLHLGASHAAPFLR